MALECTARRALLPRIAFGVRVPRSAAARSAQCEQWRLSRHARGPRDRAPAPTEGDGLAGTAEGPRGRHLRHGPGDRRFRVRRASAGRGPPDPRPRGARRGGGHGSRRRRRSARETWWCRPYGGPAPTRAVVACRAGRQDFCVTGDFRERGIKEAHGFLPEWTVEERGLSGPGAPQARRRGGAVRAAHRRERRRRSKRARSSSACHGTRSALAARWRSAPARSGCSAR